MVGISEDETPDSLLSIIDGISITFLESTKLAVGIDVVDADIRPRDKRLVSSFLFLPDVYCEGL